jgi:hypothetical protein
VTTMGTKGYGEIRCKFCRRWQRSDFQHLDEESFMAAAPWSAEQECQNPLCRQWIAADAGNVRWHAQEERD